MSVMAVRPSLTAARSPGRGPRMLPVTSTNACNACAADPGCSLLGQSACSIDSSSLVLFGGSLEATSGLECVNTFWDVATDAKQKLHSSQLPLPTPSGAYSTTFKLLVVGDAGVGKTCLITRFVDDVFSSTCKSTIGVDFKATTIEMDGKAVQLQVTAWCR